MAVPAVCHVNQVRRDENDSVVDEWIACAAAPTI